MSKLIAILAMAVTLTVLVGCEQRQEFQERRLTMRVEDIHFSSKTNSKVILRDVNSGIVYPPARLSCSRSRAENVEIGSLWDVTEMTYVYPESKRYVTELLGTSAICDLSN